jgi:hypothetical protein
MGADVEAVGAGLLGAAEPGTTARSALSAGRTIGLTGWGSGRTRST